MADAPVTIRGQTLKEVLPYTNYEMCTFYLEPGVHQKVKFNSFTQCSFRGESLELVARFPRMFTECNFPKKFILMPYDLNNVNNTTLEQEVLTKISKLDLRYCYEYLSYSDIVKLYSDTFEDILMWPFYLTYMKTTPSEEGVAMTAIIDLKEKTIPLLEKYIDRSFKDTTYISSKVMISGRDKQIRLVMWCKGEPTWETVTY